MKIRSALAPGTLSLAKLEIGLSREAKRRQEWFDYYKCHNHNARLTCRHFDISPQTFYRWLKRYDPKHPKTLEGHSHRPKKVRQPEYHPELVQAVARLRSQYPRWGKDKLAVLVTKEGFRTSPSTVGRIIACHKRKGLLVEPISRYISARKRHRSRPYAIRKPKEYQATSPGDIVELDTLDIRPLPGVLLKHFTAYDVVSRWNVLGVSSRASAATAAHFLETLIHRMPYPIKSIQVDGGSEFEADFETACQKQGIKLFVLPPRSPKLNGGVERANRVHTEEFYEVTDSSFDLVDLRPKLLEWEKICNTYRPNQALGYLTPLEYLEKLKQGGKVSLVI